ncbi:MAG: hypothetical protein WDM87_13795 [Terracidiphilus sp.]
MRRRGHDSRSIEIHHGTGRSAGAGSGTEHEQLEGSVPSLATEQDLKDALEKAFDYRGDITITLKSGEKIEALHLQSPRRRNAVRFVCAVLHPERA